MAKSIESYGFTTPLLVDDDGVLIYGHGRHEAALSLGLKEVPVCIASGWSEAEKSAYRITDNQLGTLSEWNVPALKAELQDLTIDPDLHLDVLGFSELQLGRLGFQGFKIAADPDAAPDAPADPVSKPGDVWLLGDHVLVCGDATSPETVAQFEPCAMTFTDPPYGVGYIGGGFSGGGGAATRAPVKKTKFGAVKNDSLSEDDLLRFLIAYMQFQPLAPKAAQYVFHPSQHAHIFRAALMTTGYKVRSQIIWVKSQPVFNLEHYKYQHEPIFYAVPLKHTVDWHGDRTQTSVWEADVVRDREHATQKPVELAVKAILNSSQKGEAVYEPFSGSGSTIIACEQTERRCMAVEIDPRYVDVAVQRWETFTGKKAQKKTPTG